MDYTVEPGIYAVGKPDETSPVLVSANYKLTFDILRKNLSGLDCWLLILDTKGINVWCAAGKGTFGANELVKRIESVVLSKIVKHKKLILPQLGASGVSGYEITNCSFATDPAAATGASGLRGRACYAGLDLASTTDITAFVLVFPPQDADDKYIILLFFCQRFRQIAHAIASLALYGGVYSHSVGVISNLPCSRSKRILMFSGAYCVRCAMAFCRSSLLPMQASRHCFYPLSGRGRLRGGRCLKDCIS